MRIVDVNITLDMQEEITLATMGAETITLYNQQFLDPKMWNFNEYGCFSNIIYNVKLDVFLSGIDISNPANFGELKTYIENKTYKFVEGV